MNGSIGAAQQHGTARRGAARHGTARHGGEFENMRARPSGTVHVTSDRADLLVERSELFRGSEIGTAA